MTTVEDHQTIPGVFGLNALSPHDHRHSEQDSLLTGLITICKLIEEQRDILNVPEYCDLVLIAQRLRTELNKHINQFPSETNHWQAVINSILDQSSRPPDTDKITTVQTEAI